MKFFQGKKQAVLWDAKKNAPVFMFEKRFLETDDDNLIKLLLSLGYEAVAGSVTGNVHGPATAAEPENVKPNVRLKSQLDKMKSDIVDEQ